MAIYLWYKTITSFRDKMDIIDYIIISPSLIANIREVNSELDIPSDHCTMTVTLKSEKNKI